jgi:lipopolysaccharide export LptBFGC system permease protein LptF
LLLLLLIFVFFSLSSKNPKNIETRKAGFFPLAWLAIKIFFRNIHKYILSFILAMLVLNILLILLSFTHYLGLTINLLFIALGILAWFAWFRIYFYMLTEKFEGRS